MFTFLNPVESDIWKFAIVDRSPERYLFTSIQGLHENTSVRDCYHCKNSCSRLYLVTCPLGFWHWLTCENDWNAITVNIFIFYLFSISHFAFQGASALFDMIEYYESATHLNISFNKHIGTRGWQAAAHMMRKVRVHPSLH